MIDPRLAVIERRLAGVRRVVAVTGGKGGIGKSLVAATMALELARRGPTGLMDLDFTGPCGHLILGADVSGFPEEDFGILPPEVAGVRFLSVATFSGSRPTPLRGPEMTGALTELLAITRWGELDTLVVDMPPGLGDAVLDTMRLLPRTAFLVVAGGSRLVADTVGRTLGLLAELDQPVLGVVENMAGPAPAPRVARLVADYGVRQLPALPYDPAVEDALGDPVALGRTDFGRQVAKLATAVSG